MDIAQTFHFHYTDFADIIRALYDAKVTNKWLEIGLFLGISFGQLQTLKSKSDDDRVSEMVGFWTRWSYEFKQFGKPSWKNLVRAIGARAGGNARRAAKRIADKHKLGSADSTLSIRGLFTPAKAHARLHCSQTEMGLLVWGQAHLQSAEYITVLSKYK